MSAVSRFFPDVSHGRMRVTPSLAWLLDPVSEEEFFSAYWERDPLVIGREDAAYLAGLLNLTEVDGLLASANQADIALVRAEESIKRDQYCKGGRLEVAKLLALFGDGATIILNQLQGRVPALRELCSGLERRFSCPFQTNIYLTPPRSQGFRAHYDTHDVFILQLVNSKRWRLFDSPVPLPMRGQGFDKDVHKPGPVSREFVLHPGDVAYIPRGLMHEAHSGDEVSMHITLGALAYTWADALIEAVAAAALADVELRRALPSGFAEPTFPHARAEARFRELLQCVADGSGVVPVLQEFHREFLDRRRLIQTGQLQQVLQLASLDASSILRPRPGLVHRFEADGEGIALRVEGRRISFPAHAAEAVRAALSGDAVQVGDLPGDLDEAGKCVLARRLVREGLLTFQLQAGVA